MLQPKLRSCKAQKVQGPEDTEMVGGRECNMRKEVNVQFWPKVDFYGQNLSKTGFTNEMLISV